ncbi:MAG TPA: GntR family transcriptional regulator [Methylomirabilota bacterium]|jgi:DNA-binding transcriptional regulator YhcF (GntR family)|nr:GntR family transcriptional regulator [Methylomirabilota bacterium]
MHLHVDAHSPIPIRRQLTEQLKHAIEGGGLPRDQALPSIRELAGFLRINPNTVARVIEDLKRSRYVVARRGKGVFVAPTPPGRPSPTRRQGFLQEIVTRGAALGMTADDLAVGVLSLIGVRPAAIRGAVEVLLVECSPPELEFFATALEAHLPVRVDKVLLGELATVVRRQKPARRWGAAVTSFCHLPEVERRLGGLGIPVIALLAEARLETLHHLAQLPPGTRVGVVSAAVETAHSLEHSIANASLPNIVLVGTAPAEDAALRRLVRRVDVIVCSSPAGEQVRRLAGAAVRVIMDDRALDPRAIEMLAALLVRQNGNRAKAVRAPARRRLSRVRRPPAARRVGRPDEPVKASTRSRTVRDVGPSRGDIDAGPTSDRRPSLPVAGASGRLIARGNKNGEVHSNVRIAKRSVRAR